MNMNRDSIDVRYKWDLNKFYSSKDEFKKDISWVYDKLPEFLKYESKVLDEDSLYELLCLEISVDRVIDKLQVYTSMLNDEDTSINKNRELKEEVSSLYSEYLKKTYFISPNILKLSYDDILKFMDKNDKLKEFSRYFYQMFRYKDHTLSDSEEKLLASLSKVFGNNYETYELFKDSDMEFPSFSVGDKVYDLTNSSYSLYIESNDQNVRREAFRVLYDTYRQFKNVYANLVISNVKEDVSLAHVRGYGSALEASLYRDEVSREIYDNLITTINQEMPVIHRYYDLKKKVLGLDELHLYDVYANLVVDSSFSYSFDKAKETVISALSILGDDYINILKNGIENRWIDVYPNKGKRTGGYSSGCYDTDPYILLNYQDKYDDMSTLAHELGHSIHSYFTRSSNPYQYGSYSIFVAEVASTVNELLLAKYVINNSNDRLEKLFILNRMMELFRATIFRQTMFAEFERDVYDKIEKDEPLTADILCEMYYELNRKYFGENVLIDDEIKYEWERIPHFYYNFYVYKYATGLSAACYIVTNLLNGNLNKDDYIAFLKCGRSKSPLDSLKVCGVDLTNKSVIESAVKMFAETIEDFNKLYFL